ncbi:MAG: anthranilate synthase component I family protein [Rickettsiaceae bacterium H1]|nr:anthranilate synthase component I family protein [Rickettsiaceae bacterium H1]
MWQYDIPWINPLKLAAAVDDLGEDFVFLYSSLLTKYSGRYSYLAYSPIESVKNIDDFQPLSKKVRWFGYLGYEMLSEKNDLERYYIKMPDMWMVQFAKIIVFDHEKKVCSFTSYTDNIFPDAKIIPSSDTKVSSVHSNMTKEEYCRNIEKTLDAIVRGDFYQANITRKFYGTLSEGFSSLGIFAKLSECSPGPYSAFLKLGKYRVISSSPEMFIKLSAKGLAENNLIKGTSARFSDIYQDELSKIKLQKSEKDQSEHIMIADLMRNDFTKGSYADSIKVEDLYKIYSYETVHHALSTVRSRKLPNVSSLQFVKNCFPAGSITGAPKIQVMKWCRQIEKWRRGLYTGSIGWFDEDGSLDLSVVIRTLIIEDNKFEFQVGGGIVYESTPEGEWRETLTKSIGIAKALNLGIKRLEEL